MGISALFKTAPLHRLILHKNRSQNQKDPPMAVMQSKFQSQQNLRNNLLNPDSGNHSIGSTYTGKLQMLKYLARLRHL